MNQAREFTAAERRITLAGVMIVSLLSALDQTIVSTAMPVIISQLHGLELVQPGAGVKVGPVVAVEAPA